MDWSTLNKKRFDVARILIRSSSKAVINKLLKIKIDDDVFDIRLIEEPFVDFLTFTGEHKKNESQKLVEDGSSGGSRTVAAAFNDDFSISNYSVSMDMGNDVDSCFQDLSMKEFDREEGLLEENLKRLLSSPDTVSDDTNNGIKVMVEAEGFNGIFMPFQNVLNENPLGSFSVVGRGVDQAHQVVNEGVLISNKAMGCVGSQTHLASGSNGNQLVPHDDVINSSRDVDNGAVQVQKSPNEEELVVGCVVVQAQSKRRRPHLQSKNPSDSGVEIGNHRFWIKQGGFDAMKLLSLAEEVGLSIQTSCEVALKQFQVLEDKDKEAWGSNEGMTVRDVYSKDGQTVNWQLQ
ncbi:hypothetical protein RIF29_13860 [Crotalaria pallida]|uniref:Uncharacterized protein n=1 Tax=Crotalaria pallida TaxID=3830 RepID=A0AAN9FFQ5_CROPI